MTLTIGTQLGSHEITALLGKGGMGEVYVARDTKLNRRVALKVLPVATAQSADARERFEREAKAVAALNHPNIVTIYSVEEAAGTAFMTMELVEGKPISELIPRGGMALDRILQLMIQLTGAVSAAHEKGITHRDIKPANIMVTGDGRVKVLDFGLAKLREEQPGLADAATNLTEGLTGEGRIVGTALYMSPEQAEGRPIDTRSDIFSIGVVLYEMATGQCPFEGNSTVSILSSILKDDPPPITELNHALPRDLARIVKRCLSKDPERRYQTVKDLRNDLETLRDEAESGEILPSPEAAASAGGSAATWRFAFAAAVIIAIAAIGFSVYRFRETPASPAVAPAAQELKLSRLTSTGKASLAAISPDGKYVAHVVVESGQQSLWMRQVATTSNVQIVPPAAVRYDGLAFSPDGNFVYYSTYPQTETRATLYSVPVLGGTPKRVFENIDSGVSFSPDGQRFAAVRGVRDESDLLIVRADGTLEKTLATTQAQNRFALNNPSWSPDGRWIAVAQTVTDANGFFMRVVSVDAQTGAIQSIGAKRWLSVGDVAWMPDGKSIVFTASDFEPAQIWRLSYPAGKAQKITNDLSNFVGMSVSSDGRSMVVTQTVEDAHLWTLDSGSASALARQITNGSGRADGGFGLSWTPDGKVVYSSAASGGKYDIWICNSDGTNAMLLSTGADGNGNPVVSADGRYVVFRSLRGGSIRIWRANIDGGNPQPLSPGPLDSAPILTPDGRWIIYSSGDSIPYKIWKVPIEGGSPVEIPSSESMSTVTAVSPAGTQLAAILWIPEQHTTKIALRPIDSAAAPAVLGIPATKVQWMPDGRALSFIEPGKGANLWSYRLPSGPPKQLTSFMTDRTFSFAWSKDGKRLLLSRGTVITDVVLVSQLSSTAASQK
jgi:Tol biopolymer transport system component